MNIKSIYLALFSLIFILALACNKDDDKKSELEIATENISKTWKVNSVSPNATGDPEDYKKIELTFSKNGTYTMANPNAVVPNTPAKKSTGTWKFSTDLKQIIFDGGSSDEKTVDNVQVNASSLKFSFQGKTGPKDDQQGTIEYDMTPKQ